MKQETKSRNFVRLYMRQVCPRKRASVCRVIGALLHPFEARHIGQVREVGHGSELGKELWKLRTIPGQHGRSRRPLKNEGARRSAKEVPAQKSRNNREEGCHNIGEAHHDIVAINRKSLVRGAAMVAADASRHGT